MKCPKLMMFGSKQVNPAVLAAINGIIFMDYSYFAKNIGKIDKNNYRRGSRNLNEILRSVIFWCVIFRYVISGDNHNV